MYVSDRTEEGVDGAHTNTLENIGRIEMGVPLHTIDWVDHREAKRHKPDLAARISGVETLDDARDSSIVAMARNSFASAATAIRRRRNRASGAMTSRSSPEHAHCHCPT
jgi:hypothetical protein